MKIIEMLHLRVFGHDISDTMRQFLMDLSWSFVGVFFAAFMGFIVNVVAGRVLGPAQYGAFNYIIGLSGVLSIFIYLGMDGTTVKYISSSKELSFQNKVMSNAIILFFITSIFVVVISTILNKYLARAFNIEQSVITIVVFFATVLGLKAITDGIIKGLGNFKYQSIVKIIESLVISLLFFTVVVLFGQKNYIVCVCILILATFITVTLYAYKLRKRIVGWNKQVFKVMFPYAKLNLTTAVLSIFSGSIDKIFIGRFWDVNLLGLYSAYLLSSVMIVSQVTVAIGNVLFTSVNKSDKKSVVIGKIDRIMAIMFIPIIVVMSVLSYTIIRLFGSAYAVNYFYILMVAFLSYLQIYACLYMNISSSSVASLKAFAKYYFFKPILIIGLFVIIYLFQNNNLFYVFSILIISTIFDIIVSRKTFRFLEIL